MRIFRDENGQTLVLTALLMCVLMGFMALSIDMGVAFRAQRRLQTQADAAVTAAALCGTYGGNFCTQYSTNLDTGQSLLPTGSDAISVAKRAAAANGMPSNANISVHTSPGYGQHTGAGWYEAIITTPSAAPFMGTFSGLFNGGSNNYAPLTVGARAVAGLVPGQTCMYALNQTADHAVFVKGGAGGSKGTGDTIYAPVCSIQVNSNASDALCTTGNATIDTQQIIVVGSQDKHKKCNGSQSNVQAGGSSAQDPLSGMTDPSNGCKAGLPSAGGNTFGWGGGVTDTLSQTTNSSGVTTLTLTSSKGTQTVTLGGTGAGSYSPGGSGTPSVAIACFQDAVKLTSSLGNAANTNNMWVFQKGLDVSGSSLVVINGTVELTAGSGTFTEDNSNVFINGPTGVATGTSGQPYTGMAFLDYSTGDGCSSSIHSMGSVPSGDGCLQLQFGSGGSTLQCSQADITAGKCNCNVGSGQPGLLGTVYAPKSVVFMQDSGSCVSATNLIADEIWDNGSLSIYNYNLAVTTSPLDVVRIVE